MDTSNHMFAALTRITSSIVSSANNGFGRVLEFTGSFNDRTSLLLPDDAPGSVAREQGPATTPPPPSQSQEASPAPVTTSTRVAFDVEAATAETLIGDSEQGRGPTAQDAEAKRVAKSVHTVSLFAASASLMMFFNLPGAAAAAAEQHGGAGLYIADIAFICLAFFTSLVLSMYSIVARSSGGADDAAAAVARVQKRAMVMAVAFVLVSFTLRVCMMLPAAALESSAWLVFVLLAGAAAVYLALAWRFGGAAARGAETASGAEAADRV